MSYRVFINFELKIYYFTYTIHWFAAIDQYIEGKINNVLVHVINLIKFKI